MKFSFKILECRRVSTLLYLVNFSAKKKKTAVFFLYWFLEKKTDVPEIELVSRAQTIPVKKYGTFAVG